MKQAGLDFVIAYLPPDPNARRAVAKKEPKKEEVSRDLSSYLPPEVTGEVSKSAEQYFQEGFREYRAKNYLRARESFQLSLQMNPAHEKSKFYLTLSIQEADREVRDLMESGERSIQAGRLGQARAFFEMALRRLPDNEENPKVKTCKNALKDLKQGGRQ